MDEQTRNETDAAWWQERYAVRSFPLTNCDRPIKLRDSDPRRCRFCGRGEGDVTFSDDAHAVSEFLGNKCLISSNECDQCNQFFANHAEDHLAKATLPLRTFFQTRGKRGVPTYKAKGEALRVEVGEQVNIAVRESSTISDDGQSQLDFSMKTQPFVPLAAAKALVKFASSLAAENELPRLSKTIEWLRSLDTAKSPLKVSAFPIFFGFVPGPNPYGGGQVNLLIRRDGADPKLPFMWIVVGFGNCHLQALVPFCDGDAWESGTMKFDVRHFPLMPINNDLRFGPNVRGQMDWAGVTAVEADLTLGMHYDLKVKVEPPKQ